jgi:chromosome segregation ATPase
MVQVARAIQSNSLPPGGIQQIRREIQGLQLVLSADDERLHNLQVKQASLAKELEEITKEIASLNSIRGEGPSMLFTLGKQ